MPYLNKKQYDEYEKYRREKEHGRILDPEGLRFICAANNYDAEKIGQHFLEILGEFNKGD